MVARARARAAPPPPRRILCPGAGGASGLAPAAGYLEARLRSMGEFARADMPGVDLYELLPLVDSSDMGPRDWLRVGAAIEALDARYAGGCGRRRRCCCFCSHAATFFCLVLARDPLASSLPCLPAGQALSS